MVGSTTIPVLRTSLSLRFRPKHQRTGALQDASRGLAVIGQSASVLECGGPPPLFIAHEIRTRFQTPFAPFVHPKLPLAGALPAATLSHGLVIFVGDEVTSLILISDWR